MELFLLPPVAFFAHKILGWKNMMEIACFLFSGVMECEEWNKQMFPAKATLVTLFVVFVRFSSARIVFDIRKSMPTE